ncbi:Transcriptional regulators [Rubrobacter radiotolerans]|uniref:MarR family transcriptional regulator n=1 Tax=Rubrobacter radiotolerans TaxID=42256 RepID=A0A023X4Z0_RUBRA|nr:MarR family transcriptional regulator [Rubrobacter radiotolerans]AHY47296.1 Transcriptional regulators [Rubrobacter radiotolerans]MDX5894701.1 MarR family transcriptional regulator [Rubrobacter radiotolerans]SMC06572.1 transcriptional regulator, MarR family [Rubrobacter radiotolerans DSM 5868]
MSGEVGERRSGARVGIRRPGLLSWLRMMRFYSRMERFGDEQLRPFGLNMGQFDVLARVGASEGVSQGELAASLLVSKGNIAQLIRKMEGRGLIRRESEGRMKRVYLTPAGRELFERVVPAHEEAMQSRFAALTESEQRTLYELLRKLDRWGGGER